MKSNLQPPPPHWYLDGPATIYPLTCTAGHTLRRHIGRIRPTALSLRPVTALPVSPATMMLKA